MYNVMSTMSWFSTIKIMFTNKINESTIMIFAGSLLHVGCLARVSKGGSETLLCDALFVMFLNPRKTRDCLLRKLNSENVYGVTSFILD